MELIDLQERTDLKAKYVEINPGDFYGNILFYSWMKSLYQSVMTDKHLENGLRVATTSIKVNLNKVVQKKSQLRISH